ncbi:alpha/beta fold hydrolase [Alicyclobacillus dauci]|uniref:Alpha/beta hydrolase n=1 Tax=Alicyclobacillus dauci TaxID=1475485 RepID=A0ABY6Z4T3_9BACL|nr:alpha/beta hydrolase [Alicyclobacillus dauci]WAH37211.1 alpha/beta hydrolase [Alicyclobacillus dauci]
MAFKTPEGEALFIHEYDSNLKLWPISYETLFVSTSYGQTHILVAGAENLPPLIMFHGAGMGSSIWYKNIGPLSEHYRVYAIDVMGDMNKSEPVKSISVGADTAAWVCEVLDGLGVDKTDVIGHSAGGYTTLNFVIHAQHRVRRVVLLAPAASFVSLHRQFFLRLALINLVKNKRFIQRFFCNWFMAKGNRVVDYRFEQFIYGVFYYKWKTKPVIPSVIPDDQLRSIRVPMLLLIGDQEVIYDPRKAIASAKKSIAYIETRVIPNSGHCLFIEQADLVNRYMMEFLSRVSPKEAL